MMNKETKARPQNDIPGSTPTLSVAEYKATMEKGVPLKFFKEAKK
jgi:hypothetical protein